MPGKTFYNMSEEHMAKDDLTLISPDPAKHRDEMYDLIGKVFSHHGYYMFRDYCRETYIGYSHYDWTASRIGLVGGKIVTHCGIWGYQMRIGQARVRVGGIGAVATDGDYRGHGLMARTLPATIDAMNDAGYDMSLLFGIDDYYDRFGFVRAWSDSAFYVSPADLPDTKAPALKQLSRWDDKALIDLGNRAYAGLTGSALRPTYQLLNRRHKFEVFAWSAGRGKLAGYVVTGIDHTCKSRLLIVDAVGDPAQVLPAVAAIFRQKKKTELKFVNMHPENPVSIALRHMNCREEIYNRRCGGPMIRTLNLRNCLTKMQGELSSRLGRSSLARWTGRLLVSNPREKVVLDIRDGAVRVAADSSATAVRSGIRGGEEIAQLLLGTYEPMETVEAGDITLSGNAALLLPVLFPAQHPMLVGVDRF